MGEGLERGAGRGGGGGRGGEGEEENKREEQKEETLALSLTPPPRSHHTATASGVAEPVEEELHVGEGHAVALPQLAARLPEQSLRTRRERKGRERDRQRQTDRQTELEREGLLPISWNNLCAHIQAQMRAHARAKETGERRER